MIQNITHSLIDVFDEVVFKKNIKKKKGIVQLFILFVCVKELK